MTSIRVVADAGSTLRAALWDHAAWPPWRWTLSWDERRTPLFNIVRQSNDASATATVILAHVYMLNLPIWLAILAFTLGAALCALPTALLVYHFIVQPQQPTPVAAAVTANNGNKITTKKKQSALAHRRVGTTAAGYLLGWGLLVPLWVLGPAYFLDHFCRIDHLVLRFCVLVITPTVSLFRVTEALYGFAPAHACQNWASYCLYFCSPLTLVRREDTTRKKNDAPSSSSSSEDTVFVRASPFPHFAAFAYRLVLTGAFQSFFGWRREFPTYGLGLTASTSDDAGDPNYHYTYDHYFHYTSLWNWRIWRDSLLQALLFQLYLSTFGKALQGLTTLVTGGCQTEAIFDNPLLGAQSVSDFWGRRWNRVIHLCLKNGVYKPVRSVLSGSNDHLAKALAVLASFLASGLFHEWLLPHVFDKYPNTHGTTLVFFVWQAVLLILEGSGAGRFARHWPRPLKTACVVALGLPVAHWFVDSYWRSDFFVHAHLLFPLVLPPP